MTFEERLEQLLNRANNTISDLPTVYTDEHRQNAMQAAAEHAGYRYMASINDCLDYICHLADIIDRMETALNNTLERNESNDIN